MTHQNNRKINRRDFIKQSTAAALTTVLSSSLWLSGCGKQWRRRKPNIILIVIDTLRADHVGCYGYRRNTTPNIDHLAQETVLFKNAISPASWTLPAIAALLTSQYPCVLGIYDAPAVINQTYPLLSQLLKQYGYTTAGVFSHVLLSSRLGFGRGFDSYHDKTSPYRRAGATSSEVTQQTLALLQKEHEQPFFLFLHYFDPHYNFILHEQYDYYPQYRGGLRSNHPIIKLWRMRHELSEDDMRYLLALYDSEIAFTDEHIGRLLDELKEKGFYDDSIIIVTSDHGEEFMERGWIGHCTTLYQELLHVPLIMKFPGFKPRIIDPSAGLIDIMPTVYRHLGLKIPDALEGRALDLSRGHSTATGPIFSETFNPQVHQPETAEPIAFRAIVLGDWKLIYDEIRNSRQVYNLSDDPHERNNLSAQHSERNRVLERLLSKWLDYVKTKQKPGTIKDASELFTPEQRKQLESLGYL